MKLKTTLNGQTFAFRDIRDVLAKANEPKAADRLQGRNRDGAGGGQDRPVRADGGRADREPHRPL